MTYTTLIAKFAQSAEEAREFLVSRVNRCELQALQGMAEFDGHNELAYMIWEVK